MPTLSQKIPAPLFSIVTVTLNCAEAASQTATNVLNQSFHDYQYLIKDGGSIDGTVEQLRSLGVNEIISEADLGIYDAMNRAVELCRGEYICFLNAGDLFIDDQVLEKMAGFIQLHPGHSFFCGDLLTMEPHPLHGRGHDGQGRIIRFPESFTRRQLFTESVCQQTWFVKRELYLNHPLDTSLSLNADHEFFIYWLTRTPDCYRHFPQLVARYAAGGASERQRQTLRQQRKSLMERYFTLNERTIFTLWLRARQIHRLLKYAWSKTK